MSLSVIYSVTNVMYPIRVFDSVVRCVYMSQANGELTFGWTIMVIPRTKKVNVSYRMYFELTENLD